MIELFFPKEELEKVKTSVKEKIAEEIKSASEERTDKVEDLKKAAEAIQDGKQPKAKSDTIATATGEALGETIQDVTDTVKAIAEVGSEKITEAIQEQLGSAEEE